VTAGDPLDRFQAGLLEGLRTGAPPDVVADTAQALAPDPAVEAWVANWDPDLVALATELIQTWAPPPE
jgi:hypothetical protein